MMVSMGAVSPSSTWSAPFAYSNRPSFSAKQACSSCRLRRSESGNRECPLTKSRSNTCSTTRTFSSSPASIFRLRVDSTWNGSRHPFSRSYATTSASTTQLVTPSALAERTMPPRSGYFSLLSSLFREKMRTEPSSSRCTYTYGVTYIDISMSYMIL